MSYFVLIPIVAFFINLFVWAYVLGQRQQDPISRGFLLMCTAAGGWILTDFLMTSHTLAGFEIAVIKTQAVFWMPMGVVFLNFAYAVAERKHDGLFITGVVVSVIGILFFTFTDWLLLGFEVRPWGYSRVVRPVPYFALAMLYILFGAIGLGIIYRTWRRTTDSVMRTTLSLMLVGGGFALLLVAVLNVLLPAVFNVLSIPRFGSSALVIFIFIVFLAVAKYRFLAISADKVAEELFEGIDDGIIIIDRFGEIQRSNPKAERLMERTETRERLKSILNRGSGRQIVRFQGTEGESRGAERILSVSVSDASYLKETIGKIAILSDITEQTHAEDILKASKEALEKEVEQRVVELRHAQKLEAIGTLADGIAHDLNNILAAITGFTHAALQGLPAVHPIRSDLNEVIIASGRAREIVQQMLTFRRGRDRSTFRLVLIKQILDEVIELLKMTSTPSIRVETEFDMVEGAMRCDPTEISQVFMNLGMNAIQSMATTGGGRLDVSAEIVPIGETFARDHERLCSGPHVCIRFRDNGAGIAPEVLSRIFDPFFTTKTPGEGTGLGFSTAFEIVKSHDGAMTVESEVGKGTCFTVYLPVVEEEEVMEPMTSMEVVGGDEHIVVVDDEVPLQRVAKRLLEPLGYHVSTFSNGVEALTAIREMVDEADLVVTDQTMPEMTGLQLARELKKLRPSLPVILLSGYGATVSSEAVQAAGIRAFLKKPVAHDRLPLTVRSVLDAMTCGSSGD